MLTKPRDPSKTLSSNASTRRNRRFSPLMLIGVGVTVLVAMIAVGVFAVLPQFSSHAANPNPNCTIVIPPNPLSAQGLATPYQLVATDPAQGPCNEANTAQSAFVQADIIDPATGKISTYEPLVIDKGTTPAVAPTVPVLPANAVVALWFGFNGTTLTQLQNNARTRGHGGHHFSRLNMQGGTNGNCVPGTPGSPFGQFSYCNAPNFFRAANAAIQNGQLTVPALGTGSNGQACPSVRSFTIVDMDQSDNVQTTYLVTANGQTAQFSAANQAQLANATTIGNPSDNALVSKILDPAFGCTPWTVPDLANNNNLVPTLATDELQAAAFQAAPIALVPGGDEMTLVNGNPSLTKTNLYRAGVDQTPAASLTGNAATDANTTTYCQNIIANQLPFLQNNMALLQNVASPDGGAATSNLFTFLANRLNASLGNGGLNCTGLLNIQNPVTLTTNGNGVVTAATITLTPVAAGGTTAATPTMTTTGGTTTTTSAATGTVNAILDTNAGTAQVALNLNITNFANQQFFVDITDSAAGTQLLHQMENTDGNGANAASTVINNLQGVTTIPATWKVTITDANGNMLGSATFTSNGATAVATLTTAPAAGNGGAGAGAGAGAGGGQTGGGQTGGRHHHRH